MNAMFRQGVGGRRAGTPSRAHRDLQALAACALLLATAWTGPAAASVLYRCVGAGGELAYVSNAAGYRHCIKIGQWGARPVHRVVVAERLKPSKENPPAASVLPGKPPRSVSANPAVLKITPLGDEETTKVVPPPAAQAWQPFPVVALDTLGNWVLPRVLGVDLAPATPSPAPASSAAAPAPAASPSIPLKLDSDAPRPPRRGAVYRVVEKNGTVLYTNIASLAEGKSSKMLFTYIVECYACDVHSRIDWNTVPLRLAAYSSDIDAAAKLSGVDTALLRAIIHAESGFNPRALSYKGAQGLMQLMPGTAFELGVGDAFDPAENISGGARYLAMLLRDFHGEVKLAAAAYNAGAGAVTKYGGVPPYAETQVYVKRVAILYQRYRKALAAHLAPALATVKAAD